MKFPEFPERFITNSITAPYAKRCSMFYFELLLSFGRERYDFD
jgi:hypothetical protein